ncbi:pumilio homolog 5-like isoform X2 [Aristolochia californica]|uniref:pumilio homolog 5-like isoform X2 n=1 Tax=Aristolochia californica TaxID=171875 RepID=UPI0035DB6F3C
MATESPMRIVGVGEAGKWPPSRDVTKLPSSSNSVAAQDLSSLLKGHRFRGNGQDAIPCRSGSAPPSMEGSFSAIRNLIEQQHSSVEGSLASLNSAIEKSETEEQLRADPAYLAYYSAHVNLNPRLPPPLISREKRHLAHHVSGLGDNWRFTSFDDSTSGSLFMPRAALPTHKEEPEDEKSPRHASNEWTGMGSVFLSGRYTTSSAARHKSLVDLIQEDFPRTPSPVYSQLRSSSHTATEGVGDQDVHANHLHESSVSTTSTETHTTMLGLGAGSPSLGSQEDTSSIDVSLDDEVLISGLAVSDINSIESKMEGFTISNLPKSDALRVQQEQQPPHRGSMPRHQFHLQQSVSQAQGTHSQVANTLGIHHSYNGMDHLSHAHSKSTPVEAQPVLHTSGISPPLYATATAYMAGSPFYPNLQPSSVFAPQYGMGGYALNATLFPPLIAGYPHGAIPMAYDNSAGPSFNTRSVGMSTGGGVAPGVDIQHLYKFYGQLGLALQPTFTDPLYMNYFHNPSDDAYSVTGQYDALTPRGGVLGGQDVFLPQKALPSAYTADQKSHHPRSGALSIQSPRKVGLASSNSYGSPPGMGILTQYPTSSLTSPGSPVVGANLAGRKTENFRFPVTSSRNVGAYGWQGHKEAEKLDDKKSYSFLEELKSSKARRFELSDIAGRIVEFSADQHGSRFIQQKLETCTAEEKTSVFEEVLPHASTLMTDVFGNYVIQKFFEHGSPEQRKQLADQLTGCILPLSLQMYGCRVIQKALEVIEIDQKTQLVLELDGHVMRCVRDQNGNHVIQKCIECVPTDKIGFIISAFHGQVATLSTHPYGCRVIQRVLEHCTDEQQTQCIVDEVLQSASSLAQDQYGNYVTQHVLERGKPHERSQIIGKLAGQIVQMSQHKFASNVIEKCLEHGGTSERELLIEEIVGQTEGNDNLLIMMKDQFANYVVQKILETCTDKQREVLLNRIRMHLQALKKYTYGKHIVARVEQLAGEEIVASDS